MIEHFLDPTFADSRFADTDVSGGLETLALVVGGLCSLAGIALAYMLYVRRPGSTLELAARLRPLHRFLERKWYFDDFYGVLVVRPLLALGEWSSAVFERVVIQGMVGGATAAVRTGSSIVRVAQSGLLRYYALLLLACRRLALYFLLASR